PGKAFGRRFRERNLTKTVFAETGRLFCFICELCHHDTLKRFRRKPGLLQGLDINGCPTSLHRLKSVEHFSRIWNRPAGERAAYAARLQTCVSSDISGCKDRSRILVGSLLRGSDAEHSQIMPDTASAIAPKIHEGHGSPDFRKV